MLRLAAYPLLAKCDADGVAPSPGRGRNARAAVATTLPVAAKRT